MASGSSSRSPATRGGRGGLRDPGPRRSRRGERGARVHPRRRRPRGGHRSGGAGDGAGVRPGTRRGGGARRRGRGGPGARSSPGLWPPRDRRAVDTHRPQSRLGDRLEAPRRRDPNWTADRHPADVATPSAAARRCRDRDGSRDGLRHGLHPTTRLCLAGIERWADEGRLARGARDRCARLLDLGCGSGSSRSPRACSAPQALRRGHGPDRDRGDPGERPAQPDRSPPPGMAGSLPSGAGPFDLVAANLIASVLVGLAGDLAAELRPGGRLLASGIFSRPRGGRTARLRGRGPPRPPPRCRGRLGGPGGWPTARVDAQPGRRCDPSARRRDAPGRRWLWWGRDAHVRLPRLLS